MGEAVATAPVEAPHKAGLDFEALYRSSRDDLFAYATGLLRDRDAAEDVTAAAFERAYRKRSRFDPQRGTPRAWLFGIARNAALDELRRRSRSAKLNSDPIDLTSLAGGEGEMTELRLTLAEALARLEVRERELVVLKFFAGLTNAEIARVIGTSESNAGTKVHRIVNKLREACNGFA